MHKKLESEYLPSDYMNTLQQELIAFRFGTLSVDVYIDKFHELSVVAMWMNMIA